MPYDTCDFQMEVSSIIARTDLSAEQMIAAIRAEEAQLPEDDFEDDEREDDCTCAGSDVEPAWHEEGCPRYADTVATVAAARRGT
jgi:hypothetical protein